MNMVPEERLYFDPHQLKQIEHEISTRRHIERYTMIRQWCHGVVVDCACGCGYGTNLISKNPDVKKVYGVDNSLDAITWAERNFSENNIIFVQKNMFDFFPEYEDQEIDVLVSVETIEHIRNTKEYIESVTRLNAGKVLVTYPSKKSTHYNIYHHHDFSDGEVERLFNSIGYRAINRIDLYHEVILLYMGKS